MRIADIDLRLHCTPSILFFAMGMLGDLSEFSLPDIFQMVEKSGKTGQLSIWAPVGVYRIIFYQGRVVSAIRPNSKYYLRSLLIQSGALNENGVRFARNNPDLTEPLGKFLKNNDFLDSDSLKEAFREQIQTNIYPLFSLDSGQFRLSTKTPIPYHEMTGLSRSSIEIAIEGIRQSELAIPDDENLPLPDAHFRRVLADLPLLKLSSLEWSILENITPEEPISHLSQNLKADLLEVRRAVRRLSKVSLIEEKIAPRKKRSSNHNTAKVPVGSGTQMQKEADKNVIIQGRTSTKNESASTNTLNRKLLSRFTSILQNLK